jgi:hypothetical protein
MKRMQLPLMEMLSGSLYYPSSGCDSDPILHLSEYCHSFVYVDSGRPDGEVREFLQEGAGENYHLVGDIRDVTDELDARNWWPVEVDTGEPQGHLHAEPIGSGRTPFALWAIYETVGNQVNKANRISLLYLCQDAVAAFQRLYLKNKCYPQYLAIIRPGHAMGGNWTDFTDDKKVLGKLVRSNPNGRPKYLLFGDYDGKGNRWNEYCQLIDTFYTKRRVAKLWAHRDEELPTLTTQEARSRVSDCLSDM